MPPADGNDRDVALMRSFQNGDEQAYDQLVRLHLPFVVRQARRYLNDEASADDAAQEVFLRVYRSAHLFREGSNFLGWLATIASRVALNELRTRRRKHWVASSTIQADSGTQDWKPSGEEDGPSDALLRRERIDAVREAVDRLPERQRKAIWLQRFEGWDLQQVGEALDLTVPAVKSLLHRARASLMKELEPFLKETPAPDSGADNRPGGIDGTQERPRESA